MSVEQQEDFPKAERAVVSAGSREASEGHNSKAASERIFRRAEVLVLAATLFVTVIFGIVQFSSLEKTLKSSTAATIYAQQQDIDKVFIDMPHLQPFFWDARELPSPSDPAIDEIPSSRVIAQAGGVASRILDHFEHLAYQMDSDAFEEQEDWEAYMKESFKTSQVLCLTLWEDRAEYGGTADDSMWMRYGRGNCTHVQSAP